MSCSLYGAGVSLMGINTIIGGGLRETQIVLFLTLLYYMIPLEIVFGNVGTKCPSLIEIN